jgi:hypothetical protein
MHRVKVDALALPIKTLQLFCRSHPYVYHTQRFIFKIYYALYISIKIHSNHVNSNFKIYHLVDSLIQLLDILILLKRNYCLIV